MGSSDRILQYINYKGISKREFYANTGLSNGFLDKASSIGSDKLEKIISAYPDLSLVFVVTGKGALLNVSYTELDAAGLPALVSEPAGVYGTKGKAGLAKRADNGSDFSKRKIVLTPQYITVDSEGDENILHVSARAAAGYLRGYADPVYLGKLPSFRLPGLTDASYRSFTVDGDSMYPTLKSGQMVIGRWVEKLDYIREDRVHILVTKSDGIIIKRLLNRVEQYNKIIAKSDATNDRGLYKNIEVDPDDILEVWYAVFHGGFDFQSPADMWKRVNNHEADITMLQNTVSQLTDVIRAAGLLKDKGKE
jgi:hypothetical protein